MRFVSTVRTAAAVLFLIGFGLGTSQASQLQWFGQAAFKLTTESGKVIVIDPLSAQESEDTGRTQRPVETR